MAEISGRAQVTDGDTLELGPVRIRLYGIDAPEASQTCKKDDGRSWSCGNEATAHLAKLVGDKRIRCLAREHDPYNRPLAVCTAEGDSLNARMIRDGLAWAFLEYSDSYLAMEREARKARTGIWQGSAEPPWEYRKDRWQRAADASPRPGCPIKGNINSNGEHIYHTPWSPVYDRTQIDTAADERWFCDEAEATAAGWRPARWH
ncbi:thermonuclease family protein [Methyloceanibacter stevinii]|uniref:thermonuclease family protein n=1 Tax=Methyloceanibacter stevinii TaxID=1774970 RepID=UPI001FCDD80F|nr:thermonuclease family protein [Methyloceanibacter stevinii]